MVMRTLLMLLVGALVTGLALSQEEASGGDVGAPSIQTESTSPATPSPSKEASPEPAGSSSGSTLEPSPVSSPATPPSASSAKPSTPNPSGDAAKMVLREGDLVAGTSADGKVKVMKILKISYVNGERILHVMTFNEIFKGIEAAKEALARRGGLTIELLHMLVYAEGLSPRANKVMTNQSVTESDLEGYRQYLKDIGK